MFTVRRVSLLGSLLAACGWSAVISSGSVQGGLFGNSNTTAISLAGSGGFSLSYTAAFPPLYASFPGCFNQSTCTYNFSQSVSVNSVSNNSATWSVLYNGSTYSTGAPAFPNSLVLTLTFASSSVTVPATTDHDPSTGFPSRTVSSWSNVPFTVTGSFQVKDSKGVILASDSLTGGGVAGGGGERTLGPDSVNLNYVLTPSSAPEPATFGLVGVMLALTAGLRRKR